MQTGKNDEREIFENWNARIASTGSSFDTITHSLFLWRAIGSKFNGVCFCYCFLSNKKMLMLLLIANQADTYSGYSNATYQVDETDWIWMIHTFFIWIWAQYAKIWMLWWVKLAAYLLCKCI